MHITFFLGGQTYNLVMLLAVKGLVHALQCSWTNFTPSSQVLSVGVKLDAAPAPFWLQYPGIRARGPLSVLCASLL